MEVTVTLVLDVPTEEAQKIPAPLALRVRGSLALGMLWLLLAAHEAKSHGRLDEDALQPLSPQPLGQ